MSLLSMALLAVLAAACAFLLWPRLRRELARRRELGRRALLEDLLKHVLTQRQESREASVDSVASHLGVSAEKALAIVLRAESAGLLRSESGRLRLTEEGQRWALQVVRAHRLWETWLADEARMPVSKLHKPAERQEHRLTAAARLDELDARLGHPRSDPHGDPIPTASGEIPAQAAQTLATWPSGKPARVVHVEDEPEGIFRTIMAHGLRPGSTIEVTRHPDDRLTVSDGDRQYDLPLLVAGNVHVASAAPAAPPEALVRLSDLAPGEVAEVVRIDPELRGFTRRRLLDLGLTPNSRIEARLTNAFGDPTAFRVRGTTIALRKDQASRIWVRKPLSPEEARRQ